MISIIQKIQLLTLIKSKSFYNTIEKTATAEFKDRGSKFIAYAYHITSLEEVKIILKQLKAEHPKAVHYCYAYRLGFDKTNFRHLRTEYSKVIAARQAASIDNSAGQSSDRFQITEDFSEFQNMDGLTLPSNYKLKYNYYNNSPIQSAARQTVELEWKFSINAFSYNQSLEPNSFKIETN